MAGRLRKALTLSLSFAVAILFLSLFEVTPPLGRSPAGGRSDDDVISPGADRFRGAPVVPGDARNSGGLHEGKVGGVGSGDMEGVRRGGEGTESRLMISDSSAEAFYESVMGSHVQAEEDSYAEEAEREREEARDRYVMKDYSLDLPVGQRLQWASCFPEMTDQSPRFDLILNHRGWSDVTSLFTSMLKAKSVYEMPKTVRIFWGEKSTTVGSCWNAILSHPGGPLSRLHLVSCHFSSMLSPLLRALETEGYHLPHRILLYGGALPHLIGEKTGLPMRLLQALPPPQQERAFQYMPRSYLVALPCGGASEDDQWNLWLEDFFHGDEEAVAMYSRTSADFEVSRESDAWKRPQPALDLGRNLWMSKPGNAYNATNTLVVGSHHGLNIQMVFGLDDIRDIEKKEMENGCRTPHRVLQKYVEQPPLWGGRKIDFRIFVLSIRANPPVHYFYTGQIPVRVSRVPYSEEKELSTTATFVTNNGLAKREGDASETVVQWPTYVRHLERTYHGEIPSDSSLEEVLFGRLMDMGSAILASVHSLNVDHPLVCHLTAWDVIFDRDLHPWLLEINNSFDLRPDTKKIGTYRIALVAEALDVAYRSEVRTDTPPDRLEDWRLIPVDSTSP